MSPLIAMPAIKIGRFHQGIGSFKDDQSAKNGLASFINCDLWSRDRLTSDFLPSFPLDFHQMGTSTAKLVSKRKQPSSKVFSMSGRSKGPLGHSPPFSNPQPSAIAISRPTHTSDFNNFSETRDEFSYFRGLVLDTSYRPINVVCWKKALVLEILEKADVLQYYDQKIQSPSKSWPIPAVLRITGFVHNPKQRKRRISVSRNNVLLRDRFTCQYCGTVGTSSNLTIDHVVALAHGGGASWENLVTACAPCNSKKGSKSPQEAGMKLLKKPREPKELDLKHLPPNIKTYNTMKRNPATPAEWMDWLPLKRMDIFPE